MPAREPTQQQPWSTARIPVGISSCLLGNPVRFDKGHKYDPFLVETLGHYVAWIPVCPEVEIGLGAPRDSLRLVGTPEAPRLVSPKTGADLTARMQAFSEEKLDDLQRHHLRGFVLKKNSPTCGLERVRVYDKHGMPQKKGQGMFARVLQQHLPMLPVEDEGRLHDPRLRENFVERVFAYERWLRFLDGTPGPRELVAFHSGEKLALMAHEPTAYRELGRLVAGAGKAAMGDTLTTYGERWMRALTARATPRKHANALYHAIGYFKKDLPGEDRQELVAVIEKYRTGLLPLVVPMTLVGHHLRHHPHEWLTRQSYLNPYPEELLLRNHV